MSSIEAHHRRRGWGLRTLVVIVLLGGAAAVLVVRLGWAPLRDSPSAWPIPNPDTSAMEQRVQELIAAKRAAVLAAPGSGRAWGELAMALDAHQLWDHALDAYERARTLEPDEFRWQYFSAIVQIHQGAHHDEAEARLKQSVQLKADYAPPHMRLGDLQVISGKPSEARASYQRAIELDPQMILPHRSLGQLLVQLGDISGAIGHLEIAHRSAPNDRATAIALAQAYARAGQAERAEELSGSSANMIVQFGLIDPIREEVEDLGVSTRLLDEQAQKVMSRGQFEQAVSKLRQVAERYPDDEIIQLRLGRCYQELKQPNAAILHLSNAVRLKDDLVEAHLRLAQLHWVRNDFKQAAAHYEKVIEHSPPNADYHSFRAIALANSGNVPAAIDEFKKAIQLAPKRADKRSDLGTAMLRMGKPDQALEHFQEALRLNPDYAIAQFNLATALEQLGRREEAIEHYRKARELDPSGPAGKKLSELGVN